MPQTRNFFDHDNFQSPGTHRFNENYANVYHPNQSLQPQPTQQIPEVFTWQQLSGNFLNSPWGHTGQGSMSDHGGQGSTWDAGQNNTITQVHDFLGLNEDEQLYGRGHQEVHPSPCGTSGHRDDH
jgi:hypothetical protein